MAKEKKLENSDYRLGIKDEDGSSMPETINKFSGDEHDVTSDDQRPEKIDFNEDDYFLKPIVLDGKIRKKICALLGKSGGCVGGNEIYLWNKLSDPSAHFRDRWQLELPSKFTFSHVMTTCKGVVMVSDLVKLPIADNEIMKLASAEYLEEAAEFRTDEMNDELEEDMKMLNEELGTDNVPMDLVPLEEAMELSSEENFEDKKIEEVFAYFQSLCCKKLNDRKCHKRHYLIGTGTIVVNDESYEGTHIYLYPDMHYREAVDPEKDIKDALYLQFQREKDIPGIQYARSRYVTGYIKEFEKLLEKIK